MKEKIYTCVQLHLDEVELNISVKEDLSCQDGDLANYGYIQVSTGSIGEKECFWDNLEFFLNCGEKEFKEECKKELQQKGFDHKEIYKKIKRLLKRAKKLNKLCTTTLKTQ